MGTAPANPAKRGFRLKNLPEDAYKGQQQKLKQNLIHKAKLKRNYAKVLKQEAAAHPTPSEFTLSELPGTEDNNKNAESSREDAISARAHEKLSGTSDTKSVTLEPPEGPKGSVPRSNSYRQRLKIHRADPAAAKAKYVKTERIARQESAVSHLAEIERKRAHRAEIRKREVSRTKTGQPLMKDRMKNILEKLQAESK